jgi:Fur family ferric uptake transcriptional regulator
VTATMEDQSRPASAARTAGDRGAYGFSRQTRQRRAVLRGLAAHPGFITAQTLHARLLASGERIGLVTVYRTLHTLAGAGLLDTARDPSEGQLFRIRPTHSHQHYLICRDCRCSIPVTSASVEDWVSALGQRHSFTDVQHVIELTGICAACRS